MSWQHGTSVYKAEAASVSADSSDRAAAYFFAAAGHVVSAPDYLGLGVGPGTHPYDHPDSAVTASVDALRAARSVPIEKVGARRPPSSPAGRCPYWECAKEVQT